jgi:hypothetical protein
VLCGPRADGRTDASPTDSPNVEDVRNRSERHTSVIDSHPERSVLWSEESERQNGGQLPSMTHAKAARDEPT